RSARRLPRAHVDVVAVEGDVELAQGELLARALLDEPAQALCERHAARVDADERDRLEVVVPLDDLVRDAGERPADALVVEQELRRAESSPSRVRHSTPFRPHGTGLKGLTFRGSIGDRAGRSDFSLICGALDGPLLDRYADLVVDVGANVQPGQDVLLIPTPGAARFVRAIAAKAYARGASFVDPWYFDPFVKRLRLEHAAADTLEIVPAWYGTRLTRLGAGHGCRISVSPNIPPGLLAGIDPALAGRDQLPSVPEHFEVINTRQTNWCVVPWALPEWASVVHPELEPAAALA